MVVTKVVFDPTEWLSHPKSKRLSTSYGKYSKEPYNWTLRQLYGYFRKTCPHVVLLNLSPLQDLLKNGGKFGHSYRLQFDRRTWLEENCKGYWYDLSERELDRRKTKNFRKVFIFQYEEDALYFKMVWG